MYFVSKVAETDIGIYSVKSPHVLLLAVGISLGLDKELGLSLDEELPTLGLGVSRELDGAELDGKEFDGEELNGKTLDGKELDGKAKHST